MNGAVQNFQITVNEDILADLRRRLQAAKWAPDHSNTDWRYGTNSDYLHELVEYWINGFNWREQEQAINHFTHYRVTIDSVPIHFIHERGRGPNPLPIVLTHGWPWTFWDYEAVIRPLADPGAFGADPADAFHVVVPSLPGFAFSTPLVSPGISVYRTADLWVELMTHVLGYERFAAQGGDWGAVVSAQLGHRYPEHVVGLHVTNAGSLRLFSHDRPWDIMAPSRAATPPERRPDLLARERHIAHHVAVQVLAPQTLAYALHDSPLGLCAWLLERRRNWSDCGGDVERRFSKDFLLTTTMLYWATRSFVSSARFYAESADHPWQPYHDRTPAVEAPTGITFFEPDGGGPDALEQAKRQYNVVWSRSRPTGGHFAPSEEPQALIEDIRETFRSLRR